MVSPAEKVRVVFDSRDERFKTPQGAARAGENVQICLLTESAVDVRRAQALVQCDRDGSWARYEMTEKVPRMPEGGYRAYEMAFVPETPGLYWYHFELETAAGRLTVGLSGADNRAIITEDPKNWQLTVYRRAYEVPEWFEGGVMYHIFVDRFCHEGPYVELPGKKTRRDWGGMPEYRPDQDGRIRNNDFFGGNLQGIRSKLPYLEELGVTCLYLSPIFAAYSNHKYDTADYTKIDPMFGDEETFRALCREAGERGIRVILDGVFSHTGADSIYFDKEGHYGGNGAYGNPDSPYRSWYYFHNDHNKENYETWWGIDTLPRINKLCPEYDAFICGEDGIARRWLRAGAAGWRLDVADELPNRFLRKLTKAVKTERPDALLIGEVWEDASNKIAYDERKNYFEGDKLDSVMNYPFRTAIIDFVRSGNAWQLAACIEEILEHYPEEVVHCLMNSLGTHDTERILTALGGKDLGYNPSREAQAQEQMSPAERARAVRLFMIAEALQMTLPGVPCIYYGDEAGMEGYKDPFNRRCYPWGSEDPGLIAWTKKLTAIRRAHPVYRRGEYRTVASLGGIFAFERFGAGERIITCANCGQEEGKVIADDTWQDLLTGELYKNNITIFPGQVLILLHV